MRIKIWISYGLCFILMIFLGSDILAQKVEVDVQFNVKHVVGNVSMFDRNKFVTIHADVPEREWEGDNFTTDLRKDFLDRYDVYLGRNTGGITWYLNNQVTEDPERPGYANPADVEAIGRNLKNQYAVNSVWQAYEHRNDQIIAAQLHPFWPDGQLTNQGWAFSQTDTEVEPFGTATGEYMGRFIRDAFGEGGTAGQPRPDYVEIINEPVWHLVDYGDESAEKVFRFHNGVAKAIRQTVPDIQIGGYCTAFPNHETNGFQEWNNRWKLFMDISGEYMDYWSIHLYDFPSINNGKQLYRKGSNMEATFDMMEQYSFLKFGEVKPFMISEYGAQMHDYFGAWSPYRDWLHLKSVNSMMLQFMERPHIINKTINFLPVKAEWGTKGVNDTYNHRLMRRENEPESYTGQWVYSELVKTYQLWSEVNGTRIDTYSPNADILVDGYVEGKNAYLILNNLNFEPAEIDLKSHGLSDNNIVSIEIKHLYLDGDAPVLSTSVESSVPESLLLAAEGTMILELTMEEPIEPVQSSIEKKYYADTYLQEIVSETPITFNIDNVEVGEYGEAVLRVGIGRQHGKSLAPSVLFNGQNIHVPKNFRGDDQEDRATFFGVLEIPVSYDLIKQKNEVQITFSDDGGHVSSVAMQVFNFSVPIERSVGNVLDVPVYDQDNIRISPNPNNGWFALEFKEDLSFAVTITDLSGREVFRQSEIKVKEKIDVNYLAPGVYVVAVLNNHTIKSERIIIR
uniref:MS109, putative beta-agarase n=1 Tax=Microscilla sp. PRE1 TaxID=155537 RepID=Q93PC0_9BACT|nr:T9SS type A sorting domain-containing protein [Microscilla sp. PRE1]AAK62831.1 MS109, putative beta-agarase [Microscilla sp. PRE1]